MGKLSDLGERLITEQLFFPRYGRQEDFGDDCCVIPFSKSKCIVWTIDPCPQPMSWILGYKDYYNFGWLLATINLSDIAAMGAKPIGLLTSLILPNDTATKDFERLLDGVDDACRQAGTKVLGGNIKESTFISCEATAIGYADHSRLILRRGAKVGDLVVVVGDLGLFWGGVLSAKHKMALPDDEQKKVMQNVLTPRAKIREGQLISKHTLLSSGLDNSDGIYPSVKELAVRNNVDIMLDFSGISWEPEVMKISKLLNIEPTRLAIGWGDWQLVGTVSESKCDMLIDAMSKVNTPVHRIGKVVPGSGEVKIRYEKKLGRMSPFDSERFSKKSWFTHGIDAYIDDLLNTPLITE